MDNTKKLGLILVGIVLLLILILLTYFITYLFNINSNAPDITTTTTRRIDEGFNNISNEDKLKFNKDLNEDNLLIAFNNAFDNNYNLKNINLFETEESKFKFIYTYFKLNNIDASIDYELLNSYSKKYFNTELYADNFTRYYKNNYYEYEIKYRALDYCLKAYKTKEKVLLLDMITRSETNCDINFINYEEALVIHKIKLNYEVINNDYIYKSFIIVK